MSEYILTCLGEESRFVEVQSSRDQRRRAAEELISAKDDVAGVIPGAVAGTDSLSDFSQTSLKSLETRAVI